jgi:hypothetical protein
LMLAAAAAAAGSNFPKFPNHFATVELPTKL